MDKEVDNAAAHGPRRRASMVTCQHPGWVPSWLTGQECFECGMGWDTFQLQRRLRKIGRRSWRLM